MVLLQMLEDDVHQHNVFFGLNENHLPATLAFYGHGAGDDLGNLIVFDPRRH